MNAMTSSDMQHALQLLTREVSRLTELLSPWVSIDEMCKRYNVTPKTLTAMERRGDIPERTKGRWNRSELQQWEQRRST
jgi:hypothetical protein